MAKMKYADDRREKIFDAFAKCIAQYDYEKVTMRMIAERSGLSYSCLYYYFENKDDIFAAYYQSFCGVYRERVRDLMREHSREELSDLSFMQLMRLVALNMTFAGFSDESHQNNRTTNLMVFLLAARNPSFREMYTSTLKDGYAVYEELLNYCDMRVENMDAAVRTMNAIIQGLIVYGAINADDMSVADVVNGFFGTL